MFWNKLYSTRRQNAPGQKKSQNHPSVVRINRRQMILTTGATDPLSYQSNRSTITKLMVMSAKNIIEDSSDSTAECQRGLV